MDNGKLTPEFKEAVAALLPRVSTQKDQFIPQHIANLLWAMAKTGGQRAGADTRAQRGRGGVVALRERTKRPIYSSAYRQPAVGHGKNWWTTCKSRYLVSTRPWPRCLPRVNGQKANFKPQEIANLLWATAKLGELVELDVLTSTFESIVYLISENPRLSQQELSMSLWGVMVCCARFSLECNAKKNFVLEMNMDDLFTRLENTPPDNEKDQRVIAMAACWLGRACPVVPHYQATISEPQTFFRDQLQSRIPSLTIEEEKSLNLLPPVDLFTARSQHCD